MTAFMVLDTKDNNYVIKDCQGGDNLILSGDLWKTYNDRSIFPNVYRLSGLKLDVGDLFSLDKNHVRLTTMLNKNKDAEVVIYYKNDRPLGESAFFEDEKEDNGIEILPASETNTETMKAFIEKANGKDKVDLCDSCLDAHTDYRHEEQNPNEALVLVYADEDGSLSETYVMGHGACLYLMEDKDVAFSGGFVNAGLYLCSDISESIVYDRETGAPCDVETHYNEKEVSPEEACKHFNITEDELLKEIDEAYPYHYEGEVMEALTQFSRSNAMKP